MKQLFILFFTYALISGCSAPRNEHIAASNLILDIQGHRGCRGLFPENSIFGFLHALELGVNTLEMDVVISKDHQVLLSHEPFISHLICRDSTGNLIKESLERSYNIYQMNYQEIRQFDCGSNGHPGFLEQKGMASHKPLLSEVIATVEQRRVELGLAPVYYNIETKTHPNGDSLYHPAPDKFVELLLQEINIAGIQSQTIIQSFDPRTLQSVKSQASEIKLALLVENKLGPQKNLANLGFDPEIYSPEHLLIDQYLIDFLEQRQIKLIPWTINEPKDMKKYLDMGVDGIITDYPDRLLKLLDDYKRI